jgi:cholesterol transport system auxiliary component
MIVLMKKTVGRSAVIILFGLLQACSVLPRPEVVAVEYFTLDTPAVPTVQPAPAGPVLLIARPQVRPDLDTPRMAYRQQDYTLRYYARSRWSDVPAQLLLPGLIESFESSGHFAAVLRTGSPATPQLRLDTEILEFSLDFRAQPSRFQLRLRAQLVDLGTRRVLASHAFAIEKPLEAQTPYGGAQAANAAWQALLPELVTFCTAALPPVAP